MDRIYIIGYFAVIVFFAYNIYCYRKNIVVYTIKSNEIEVKDRRYFNIQLIINSINVVVLMALTILWNNYNKGLYIIIFIVVFWAFKYLIRDISKFKKYIKYK